MDRIMKKKLMVLDSCDVKVFFSKIPKFIEDRLIQTLLEIVGQKKAQKLRRYQRNDQYCSLIGEMLLRKYLWDNRWEKNIVLKENEFGKPYVRGIEFNISHSGSWVVCAVCDQRVGIDIEKVYDFDINLVTHFFHPYEINWIHQVNGIEKINRFFKIWTKKESFIKAVGEGLSIDLSSFSVIRKDQMGININDQKVNVQLFEIPYVKGYECSCSVLTSRPIQLSVKEVHAYTLIKDIMKVVK
ncbi:4'-phosphopantetheinyl transferase superfamily protein [Caldifermentibacillus hisashii]|uniref:4'-phosphopantetheinyl transferase family protein n=1 Tax=Caldifermentibacillus hisashii TaxID=996558 RepID=UPI0034D66CA7